MNDEEVQYGERPRCEVRPKDDRAHRVLRRRFIAAGAAAGRRRGGMSGADRRRCVAPACQRLGRPWPPRCGEQDLPADAAPPEKQIYRLAGPNVRTAKVLDFYEQVYQRPSDAGRPLQRAARPAQQGLRTHPGRRRVLVEQRGRQDLDLQARARADVERRQPASRRTTGSRRSSTAPTRSTPGTSPGSSRA